MLHLVPLTWNALFSAYKSLFIHQNLVQMSSLLECHPTCQVTMALNQISIFLQISFMILLSFFYFSVRKSFPHPSFLFVVPPVGAYLITCLLTLWWCLLEMVHGWCLVSQGIFSRLATSTEFCQTSQCTL